MIYKSIRSLVATFVFILSAAGNAWAQAETPAEAPAEAGAEQAEESVKQRSPKCAGIVEAADLSRGGSAPVRSPTAESTIPPSSREASTKRMDLNIRIP